MKMKMLKLKGDDGDDDDDESCGKKNEIKRRRRRRKKWQEAKMSQVQNRKFQVNGNEIAAEL